MHLLYDFGICILATVFFAVLFRVPRPAVIPSALVAAAGYVLYEIAAPAVGSQMAGYFIGTLLTAVCSEVLARVMKMPATVFAIPSIIPLVPGSGLYDTMFDLVQGQNARAAATGTATILDIVAIAMAMVLTAIFTRVVVSLARRSGRGRT